MENSYRFFANHDCKYYPCHSGVEELNCLFCYCPFFLKERCPGRPEFWEKDGKIIKDCSNCVFPHRAENYEHIIEFIRRENAAREFSDEIRRKAIPLPSSDPQETGGEEGREGAEK